MGVNGENASAHTITATEGKITVATQIRGFSQAKMAIRPTATGANAHSAVSPWVNLARPAFARRGAENRQSGQTNPRIRGDEAEVLCYEWRFTSPLEATVL